MLPNKIFNDGLSIEAIGLLSYFLSLPHDWVIYKTQLHSQLNMGREKLDRVFKELQDKGYVLSVKEMNDKGQFTYNHIVYDNPYNGEPITENPHTEKPLTGNQLLLSTNEQSTKLKSKEDKERLFDVFWDLYDKKVEKDACKKKFLKLDLPVIEKILQVVPNYVSTTPDKQYRKNPETWINNKCWDDELILRLPEIPKKQINTNIQPTYGEW